MCFGAAASLWMFAQTAGGGDHLLQLAQANDPRLRATVRERPSDARLAVNGAIAAVLSAKTQRARLDHMAAARRLADALATEWLDPFFHAQIARAAAMSLPRARSKLLADSLRREGGRVLASNGVSAALQMWRQSLTLAQTAGDSASFAASLSNMGAAFLRVDAIDSAYRYLTRARDIARAIGDRWVEANALGALAATEEARRDLRSARSLSAQSLALRRRIGDFRGEAADYNNLGLLHEALNDRASARQAYQRSLGIARQRGYAEAEAISLSNLGNLAVLSASYDDAAQHYRDAVLLDRRIGNRLAEARVLHNWGLLDLRRGNPTAAQAHLLEALALYAAMDAVERVEVQEDLTAAYILAGDPMAAIARLREEERSARAPDPLTLASLARIRADLALEFNRIDEAGRAYDEAEKLALRQGDTAGSAAAAKGRGFVLSLQGDNAGAARVLERVTEHELGGGDTTQAAFTRLLTASALADRDAGLARTRIHESLRAFRLLHDTVGQAMGLTQLAEMDDQAGAINAARGGYQRALGLLARLDLPVLTWGIRTELGRNLLHAGQSKLAVQELRRAVRDVERLSNGVMFAARRADYLTDKWEPYGELAVAENRIGNSSAAFEVSERLRARQLLDALASVPDQSPHGAASDPLVTREKQLRRAIEWLSTGAEQGAGGHYFALRDESVARNNARALERAKFEYAGVLDELIERSPRYAEAVRARPLGWEAVAKRIEPQEAVVEYLVTDSASVAFVVTRRSLRVIELPTGRKPLADAIELARVMLDRPPTQRSADEWRAPLTRLHDLLFRPLERTGVLDRITSIVIIPHAELHYLPFAALVDRSDGRFLVDHYELSYAPSASVWAGRSERAQIIRPQGILTIAPRNRSLLGARREVAAIERIYRRAAHVASDRDATQSKFRAIASNFDIIHVATTGVLDSRHPLFSYLNLAPDSKDDGRLFVHQIFGLNLRARLVVLSACETALGAGKRSAVPAGDEWVSLVRAFFQAGAQTVLATLWQVDDRATGHLMESFYEHLAQTGSTRRALSLVQRAAITQQATAHPYFWAGFTFNERR